MSIKSNWERFIEDEEHEMYYYMLDRKMAKPGRSQSKRLRDEYDSFKKQWEGYCYG